MLIDTHCHLSDEKFDDVKKTIREAVSAGVEKIFIPSADIEDSKRSVLIAEQENLYAMVGVHPENIDTINDTDEMIYKLEEIIGKSSRVIGVGEIGLDFFWDKERLTKERQIEIFRAQMELTVRQKFPVVIHMREAEEEMLQVLKGLTSVPRGQFHCFAGSESFLEYILGLGFYISFAGNITYKSAQNLRDMIKKVPLSRLLLETDSPYLSPEPVRGRVNSPANVKIIATAIARELNLETEELIEQTAKNTLCLYSLDI
jgi:TatD DNase family protein